MQPETTAGDSGRTLVKTRWPGIYQRGGAYVVRFRDATGRQRQRAARTLAEAKRVRAEVTADVARGEYRPDARTTFAAYAATWPDHYAGRTGRGIRPQTLAEYRRDLSRAVAHFGRMRLAEFGPPEVKGYARTLADGGLAPATVRRYMAPVKALLATAAEDGLIRFNPAAGVRLPSAHGQVGEEDVKALNPDELALLVAETPEGWKRLLVVLLAETGLRIGEALALTWGAVDLDSRRVRVRQRLREAEIDRPKSARGLREVPISRETGRELAALRLASPRSSAADYVFATAVGTPQLARNAYRWLKPAAERAGVAWAGFHALRHTAASRWLHGGVGIAQVSRLLGHADPSFTLRVYISVMPSDLPDGDVLADAVGAR